MAEISLNIFGDGTAIPATVSDWRYLHIRAYKALHGFIKSSDWILCLLDNNACVASVKLHFDYTYYFDDIYEQNRKKNPHAL